MAETTPRILASGISDHPPDFRFERLPGFPCWTLSLHLRGRILCETRGTTVEISPFDLACFQPGTPYRTRMAPGSDGWQGLWFICMPREDWLPLLAWPEAATGLHRLALAGNPHRQQIRRQVQEAHDLHCGRGRQADLRALHALEAALLLVHESTADVRASDLDRRILHAADLLAADPARPIGIPGLARAAGLSPSRFAHLFRRLMGVAPMAYRERQRMRQARGLLLADGIPIQAIATTLGYESPFHFSKRFKRHHGVSPKHFRQRLGEPGFLERWEG